MVRYARNAFWILGVIELIFGGLGCLSVLIRPANEGDLRGLLFILAIIGWIFGMGVRGTV